jgi:NADH-quinone oxidoreductase subunit M
MGIYPESFIRPMRADVGRLLTRLERVAPTGDSHIVVPTMANGMHMDHGAMH